MVKLILNNIEIIKKKTLKYAHSRKTNKPPLFTRNVKIIVC